ncbi:MAG TPA: ROK family protein [Candidatus Paceibacterota bacterium]
MTYVLFDIGGTKTRVAVSGDLKTIDKVVNFKTPAAFADGVKKIVAAIEEFDAGEIKAMAGGIRGLLNDDKSGLFNDGVLDKWAGKSLVAELQKTFNVPIHLENDTAMAGLGEAVFGAGKGLDIIAYHTVSTGVGGVKIENGMIDAASSGFEPGHQVLDIDRTILGDEIVPTLENLVSGTAVEQRFGVKAFEIPQDDVLWNELAEYLAQGLRNTILYWSPDAIILGGSMIIGDPAIPVDMIRKCTVEALDSFVPAPLICAAKLKDEAGLYGAMAYLQKLCG